MNKFIELGKVALILLAPFLMFGYYKGLLVAGVKSGMLAQSPGQAEQMIMIGIAISIVWVSVDYIWKKLGVIFS